MTTRNTKNGLDALAARLIDTAEVIFFYSDPEARVIFCNNKAERLMLRTKQEMLGNDLFGMLYQEDIDVKQQMLKAVFDDVVKFQRSNTFDGLISVFGDVQRLISWQISPVLSPSQETEGVLFVGVDVTRMREREDSHKKIDETIKNIFADIKEYALYVSNLDGNITYYGMGSEAMFGWNRNEIIFKHVSLLHPEDEAKGKLSLILERVRVSGKHEEPEIQLKRKNGETFPVILTVLQYLDADSKVSGYLFIAKDITERKKIEYQMFQSEKLAAIGQLAAGMAHEINNPLFVISGRLEMLSKKHEFFRRIKNSDLKIINQQAERIRKLVDRVLLFARYKPINEVKLDINSVIEGVLPLLSYQKILGAKIEIIKDLAAGVLPVRGDQNQLEEVFINLFLNACQAMPQGGKLTIKTSNLGDHHVEIRISDTGCGIPEKNLKNIFMPFFSTKSTGTGLGLSICHNIISNHNGSVEVESVENKGTTFVIKFPVVKTEEQGGKNG
ncbi:MAG: ATP-binding protein [Candidatus Omnitrophica bacterium]|nr:ATP-binding protein [Candidatus Omnitrophota bacterium]